MRHFVDCYRGGVEPRETFVDGYVVNCVLDACYRAMTSGRWETIEIDPAVVGDGVAVA
jgi:predicted dehydrogenase